MKHRISAQFIIAAPYAALKTHYSISGSYEQYAVPAALGAVVVVYWLAQLIFQWVPFLLCIVLFRIPWMRKLSWHFGYWVPLLTFFMSGLALAVYLARLDAEILLAGCYLDSIFVLGTTIVQAQLNRRHGLVIGGIASGTVWLGISWLLGVTAHIPKSF